MIMHLPLRVALKALLPPVEHLFVSVYITLFWVGMFNMFYIINNNLCRAVDIDSLGIDREIIIVDLAPDSVGVKIIE